MPRNQGGSYVADATGQARLVERTAPPGATSPSDATPPAAHRPDKSAEDKPAPTQARRKE